MAFDLDDSELRATRKMYGLDKEKTADEMFEKLGYIEKDELKNGVEYYDNEDERISLIDYDNYGKRVEYSRFEGITMQELKAINKKCEELGWKE